jgi:hypothetical protein
MKTKWYFKRAGQRTSGPFTELRLTQMASAGQLLPGDSIRRDGETKAVRAGNLKCLFPRLASDTI